MQERKKIVKTQQEIERISERKISETLKSNEHMVDELRLYKMKLEKQVQEY